MGRQEQVDAFGGFIVLAKEALTKCQWKGYGMKVKRMPEILNTSILDLSRCQVPINADLVDVNSTKRERSRQ
jgi:hypothetical protein